MLETAVFKSAEECLNMISKRLGDNDHYLFGRSPSSADAVLYGYLAPLLKAPFPNPSLQNHLKASDNLCRFVGRINSAYFAKDSREFEKKQEELNKDKSDENTTENEKVQVNKMDFVISTSVAVTAMTLFVMRYGIKDHIFAAAGAYVEAFSSLFKK